MRKDMAPMIPKLLFEICNCHNFYSVITDSSKSHCCSEIINFQRGDKTKFHIPEPWSGDLVNAPILFISSNPGYSDGELYPLNSWPDSVKADYFINRFEDRGTGNSWVYRNRLLERNGKQGKSVRYWASIKKRAEELLGREAIPGVDYCNTELVHCKSMEQSGVRSAVYECGNNFTHKIIDISGARIIVGIGSFVKNYFKEASTVNGRPIIYLPHPNAFEPKTFGQKYTESEILKFRELIISEKIPDLNFEACDFDMPTDIVVKDFLKEQFI